MDSIRKDAVKSLLFISILRVKTLNLEARIPMALYNCYTVKRDDVKCGI